MTIYTAHCARCEGDTPHIDEANGALTTCLICNTAETMLHRLIRKLFLQGVLHDALYFCNDADDCIRFSITDEQRADAARIHILHYRSTLLPITDSTIDDFIYAVATDAELSD